MKAFLILSERNGCFLRRKLEFSPKKTALAFERKTAINVAVVKQVRTCLASPPNVSANTTVFAVLSLILSPVLTLYRAFFACLLESFRDDIFIDIRLLFWHNEFIVICF